MDKIPVGQTIALAYRFLFTEIGTILGICWFPALLSSLASYFTAVYAAVHRADIEAGYAPTVAAYAIVSVLGLAITIFAASVMAVALTRHVLGRRVTGVVAYFAVGPVEWRMFAASIRYIAGSMLLVILAVVFSGIVFRIAGVPAGAAGPMRAAAPDIIAGLVSWVAFIAAFVVILRVGFFIPPTIVAEDGGGLRRSFELTLGKCSARLCGDCGAWRTRSAAAPRRRSRRAAFGIGTGIIWHEPGRIFSPRRGSDGAEVAGVGSVHGRRFRARFGSDLWWHGYGLSGADRKSGPSAAAVRHFIPWRAVSS